MIQNNEGRYERSCRLFLSAKRRLIAATIQFFDLFSGIGGFREGLRRAGNFVCVGHCEVDTYADKNYRLLFDTEGEWYCNDARTIEPERMPDFDLLCAGFPCQAFSIAGKREGFADARGTLFFEIARILEAKRPSYFILENVPGLLSHDKGRTFCTILSTLSELGYHVEWKVLNSKDFGVPQARKRVYIVGYFDFRCAGKVLPEPETNGAALVQVRAGSQGKRVYSPKGLSCTLTSQAGGMGGKTGLYDVGVPIKENTKLGYKLAREGDSIDLGYANLNSRRGRVGHQIAHDEMGKLQEVVRCLRQHGGFVNESCGQHVHVDASNHTPQSLKNALTIMYAKEDILFKALKVQERRANSYCQRVRPEVLEKIRKIPNKSITMDRVRNVWYGGRDGSHTHYDHTRYYALNLHAVFSKGTLEWRCFESTLHAGKVRANITLALAISAQAINQRSTQMKKTLISENPAFTFRTFLLRLGLIGDEYKNVRKHLLANLDGDLAWRYDKSTYECLKKNQRTEGVR